MIYTVYRLVQRNIKIYLKDKANVFFSLLSPLIILGLYILFIGKLQIDALNATLDEIKVTDADKAVRAFCDSWMISGVMACACITVALCSSGVMIQDKQRGISSDVLASPLPKWVTLISYVIAVAIVSFVICMIVLAICFIYLAAIGNWYFTALD